MIGDYVRADLDAEDYRGTRDIATYSGANDCLNIVPVIVVGPVHRKEISKMPEFAERKATYEDLYRIPENMTGEIIDGELIVTPRPARRHLQVASSLGGELVPPYRFGRGGPGGWVIYDEPEIHFGEDVLVPDLTGWKEERLSTLPEEHRFTVPPDWVCEILSPSTARTDRIRKMSIFAQHRVQFAWIIDPILMTLEVFRLESGNWVIRGLHAEQERVRAMPFEEVELDLGNLWLEESSEEGD